MNISALQSKKTTQNDLAQQQARIDLAASHRLAVHHGLHEGIFNHFTLAVPNTDDRYYQIPFGLHWSEVSASSFMEVSFDGEVLVGEGEVERSGYCIHAPMHRLSKEAACVLHTHMPFASALARLKDQRILPIGQTELGIAMQTAYDDVYTGPAFDPAELDAIDQELAQASAELERRTEGASLSPSPDASAAGRVPLEAE
ncbi:MAG: class II aldolase/adducin family protein, partial [Rhodospirillales bacterium]|nr:class II aldolase/adducin family protein [Rhodospirillales bacterium]